LKTQTILLVDDISDNLDILVELLHGYDLVTAVDGKTALNIVKNEDVDLILLDIMMPEMDGYEVCKILKRDERYKQIPIMFLSAKNSNTDIEVGFEFGAVDYITKPFQPNELKARVDTHLKLRAYEKNLEKRVQEELEKNHFQEQMIHQQSKQAALGELLMHIAHQWKQPLSSLGSINTLQRVKLEQNIKFSKKDLLDASVKVDELILFMSQTVDTFKNFYNPSYIKEEFSLTNAVKKILNISQATLEYHGVKVDLLSYEDDFVFANEKEFAQVLFSIINNALDIFKQRKIENPQLYIKVYNHKIVIEDNGGGIDEKIKDKLFLPYETTTNGNGIGLYIAKEIIEKNDGVISIANTQDGASFSIEFLEWLD